MNRKYLGVFENLRELINKNISKMAGFDIFRNNQM